MEIDWVKFFELVERLQTVSPELLQLALRYGQGKDREVLKEVERQFQRRSTGETLPELFSGHPPRINMRRCQVLLESLYKQEDDLRKMQDQATQDLLQVQSARRAFEKSLKEMLKAEQRDFNSHEWAHLLPTEEEVMAGLQELKEKGGLELHQFIDELEQGLPDGDRNGI